MLENKRSSTEPKIGYLLDKRVTVSGATATGAIAGSLIAWSLIAWSVIAGVLREQIPENAMVSMGMGQANQVPYKFGAK